MTYTFSLMLLAHIAVISSACLGALAIFAPNTFRKTALCLSTWVKTRPTFPVVDSVFAVDHVFLKYTRVFGGAIVAASVVWAVLLGY